MTHHHGISNEFDVLPTLLGESLRVRPLAESDFEALFDVASDPKIWAQHPQPDRYRREVFRNGFFDSALAMGALLILDRQTGQVCGSSRFYDWDADHQEVAIGYTFLARRCWGSGVNRELKRLMTTHAFLKAGRVWLHIGSENTRSRRAAESIGACFSHTEEKTILGMTFLNAYYYLDRPNTQSVEL